MTLADIRDFIATLHIATDENCYMGKLDAKKQKSIGSYHLRRSGTPTIPIGGMENASYGVFPASFLIHWNKSPRETEQAADALFKAITGTRDVTVNDNKILFCYMLVPNPQDVGTDDDGIYEMVIEGLFYFERKD